MYQSAFRPGFFAGQVVVITGGGSGIGRCTAHELASLGAHVVLIGRNPDKLARVQAELREDGHASDTHALDIRNGEQVAATVAAILARHGRIDGLVNNAGGQFPSPLRDISDKGWDAVIRNNLNGGFSMMREVYVQCMERHGGAIVNIAAVVAFGMPMMGHTGAARAGMINLTQTAALEWASAGVRVNCVLPGSIASSGMATYPEDFQQRLKQRRHDVPLKRQGLEDEVSAGIVFLLSPAAAYITGAVLSIDGGLPLAKAIWPMPEHANSKPFKAFHRGEIPEFLRDED
jgi:citronellol/citronellal dehydrogenase